MFIGMTKDLHLNWRTNSQGGRGGAKEEHTDMKLKIPKAESLWWALMEDSRNRETTNEIK